MNTDPGADTAINNFQCILGPSFHHTFYQKCTGKKILLNYCFILWAAFENKNYTSCWKLKNICSDYIKKTSMLGFTKSSGQYIHCDLDNKIQTSNLSQFDLNKICPHLIWWKKLQNSKIYTFFFSILVHYNKGISHRWIWAFVSNGFKGWKPYLEVSLNEFIPK